MPSKFALWIVKPDTSTLATPILGAEDMPLMKIPFDRPVASMTGLLLGIPTRERDLAMTTCSLYVPRPTRIVSPGDAAATAAEMVVLQPNLPLWSTHKIEAAARP